MTAFDTGGELSAGGFSAVLAWAAEREREGELLAALAPLSQPGEPDRALAVFVRANRYWEAEEGQLSELCIDSGEVRVVRTAYLTEGSRRSGDRILCWVASTADGWIYVWGSRRSVWFCSVGVEPLPFPWIEYGGDKRVLLAGSALIWRR